MAQLRTVNRKATVKTHIAMGQSGLSSGSTAATVARRASAARTKATTVKGRRWLTAALVAMAATLFASTGTAIYAQGMDTENAGSYSVCEMRWGQKLIVQYFDSQGHADCVYSQQ